MRRQDYLIVSREAMAEVEKALALLNLSRKELAAEMPISARYLGKILNGAVSCSPRVEEFLRNRLSVDVRNP